MSNEKNWREDTSAETYFGHQQKTVTLADRRPVIRSASDLVGPGINVNTVRITDFNDLLATFNGYYSSVAGASAAPNASEAFVGVVVSDAEMGGKQEFIGLTSGAEFTRTFKRSPIDPEALAWSPWSERRRINATKELQSERDTTVMNNTATALLTPWDSQTIGDASVYQWTETALNIRKQGIYTGMVQIGDRSSSVVATIAFNRPQGSTTAASTHINVPLVGTFYIPFTVIATDEFQAFYINVQHTMGSTQTLWWRMSITRVGDAV